MSSITNTTISSYDYLLRNCYSSNRNARKSATRGTYSKAELISADSQALRKIAKNLKDITYDSSNGVNVYNNIKAFADTYNNLINSTDGSDSTKLNHEMKQLKKIIKEHKDDLDEIGITISSSGELTIKKETLVGSSPSKVAKVLSGDKTSFMKNVMSYASKVQRHGKALLLSGNSVQNKTTGNATTQSAFLDDALANALAVSTSSVDFKA